MIFNGLTKSDLVIFNALIECDLSRPVSYGDLAALTCYHPETVRQALARLVDYRLITRRRERPGHPYRYTIRENSYYAFSPS